jgi:glycosyltransferase involved in cell wall biosynthesis
VPPTLAPESGRRPRVGILANALDIDLTGVGKYMAELTRALCRGHGDVDAVPLIVGPLGPLADDPAVAGRVPSDTAVRRLLGIAHVLGRAGEHRLAFISIGATAGALAARRLSLDVVHDLTGTGAFAGSRTAARRLLTVHDLISLAHPGSNDPVDDLIQKHWLPRITRRIDAVLAVSDATGRDVVRFLHVPPARVHVNHHGVDERYAPISARQVAEVVRRYGLEPGYVLFVGGGNPRKNLGTLLDACGALWRAGSAVRLVVAGRTDPALSRAHEPRGRVVSTGYVPEEDLPAIYNGAAVLAYPSSYEGFGLPAIEAMRCGTPVITTPAGSLKEVAGDAAIAVPPGDAGALADALARVLGDPAVRAECSRRCLERSQAFTWSAAAERAAAVYRYLADSPPSAPATSGAWRGART